MKYHVEMGSGVTLAYTLDDYTDPWREAETIILVHGIAESGEAWRGWVPHLARNYKVIRLDLRGFGDSTPMPLDYEWSLDGLADDLDAVSYTHLRAHETPEHLVCRLLLEKKK